VRVVRVTEERVRYVERAREKVAMAGTAKTVKDVPSHDFVRAYAAHLKRSGKVSYSNSWN
jgi:hypothetical protein